MFVAEEQYVAEGYVGYISYLFTFDAVGFYLQSQVNASLSYTRCSLFISYLFVGVHRKHDLCF